MPIKVRRTDTNDYYFIVPFGKKKGYASVTAMVDSTKALFRQASWVGSEVKYLAVDKKKALSLAGFKGKVLAELVWEPNKYSSSPFRPYWKITSGASTVFITQDGQLIDPNPVVLEPPKAALSSKTITPGNNKPLIKPLK
jgi:hypothetical protein